MKIHPIFLYSPHSNNVSLHNNKSDSITKIVPNTYSSKYYSIPPQINISFGKNTENVKDDTQKTISELINDGYEVPKIYNDKIINHGRYILITSKEDFIALANSPNI